MKISRTWLQTYFDQDLPDSTALADALTFHAFEIESVENDVLDVKVTPNRGHDCLSHRGIAKEVSAILNIPLKVEPAENYQLNPSVPLAPVTDGISISVNEPKLCSRYIAGYIRGVKVGPSPDWLRMALESIGQRSINNIVDATNFVMFDTGQPLHAFDAEKLSKNTEVKPRYGIIVRKAHAGEKIHALDEKEYTLTDSMVVIADQNADAAIGIAGVKGGAPAGITEATTDIILESANFDGVSVRKTAQALKLRTDASSRFEQSISPELASYAMRRVAELIVQIAGGEVAGFVEQYPEKQKQSHVAVSVSKINRVLGASFTEADVDSVFKRLNMLFVQDGETFTVAVPLERLDIAIAEDLVEEVARIVGYDKVPAVELSNSESTPVINANFFAAEKVREDLIAQGYSEVFTSVFADKGDRAVLNKVDSVRPYLRATLVDGLKDALEKNSRNKDLLGLKTVKLFEIGTIWKKGEEVIMIGTADEKGMREEALEAKEKSDSYEDFPLSQTSRYQPFSKYPAIVRDIALWVPAKTKPEDVLEIIRAHAGELLVRSALFDQFEKGEKVSYAFRLVFQSFDKTLTDFDANERMGSVTKAVQEKGWEVR